MTDRYTKALNGKRWIFVLLIVILGFLLMLLIYKYYEYAIFKENLEKKVRNIEGNLDAMAKRLKNLNHEQISDLELKNRCKILDKSLLNKMSEIGKNMSDYGPVFINMDSSWIPQIRRDLNDFNRRISEIETQLLRKPSLKVIQVKKSKKKENNYFYELVCDLKISFSGVKCDVQNDKYYYFYNQMHNIEKASVEFKVKAYGSCQDYSIQCFAKIRTKDTCLAYIENVRNGCSCRFDNFLKNYPVDKNADAKTIQIFFKSLHKRDSIPNMIRGADFFMIFKNEIE